MEKNESKGEKRAGKRRMWMAPRKEAAIGGFSEGRSMFSSFAEKREWFEFRWYPFKDTFTEELLWTHLLILKLFDYVSQYLRKEQIFQGIWEKCWTRHLLCMQCASTDNQPSTPPPAASTNNNPTLQLLVTVYYGRVKLTSLYAPIDIEGGRGNREVYHCN